MSFDDYMIQAMQGPSETAGNIVGALELDDPAALLVALRLVAKVHGMADVARRADIGEKTLFLALSAHGNPTLSSVRKVLNAVGPRLSVMPEPSTELLAPDKPASKPG
ncbi:MAG: hypothetical protein U1F04_08740 [Burkholderiaceae bacterium]|mgnify:FL=1